ncbi:hypothetical protein [Flavobacterium sp. SM2513]|uniref:hypothetical protein n=1 Tax=Flavobacterium sp. SM2513 TaxID=3424766 RepID=UPI003D7F6E73
MLPKTLPFFLSFFMLTFCSSTVSDVDFKEIFTMPKKIKESSAVEVATNSKLIWTLEDSGNKPELFGLDLEGKIVQNISIQNVKNNDWEDLTSDNEGNLYIGDFGNNDNERKDLAIYKISATDLTKNEATPVRTISFYYPEQKAFPPKKSERNFDVESFFVFQNNFFLFTKNRSSKFDGTTHLYRVPNESGNHKATLIASFKTCEKFSSCAITSADISPNGKTIALLSSNQVWLFTDFTGDSFFKGTMQNISLPTLTQKEGICFINESTLYITEEKDKHTGGKLYQLNLSKSKAQSH